MGNFAVSISNEREVHLSALGFFNVFDPAFVVLDRVTAKSDDFDSALVEITLDFANGAELSSADRGVVAWVREKYSPRILLPSVEVDLAVG